ncbi:MAG: hypothetical protein Q9212_001158, partial [Teloschistes hypoglaucus]
FNISTFQPFNLSTFRRESLSVLLYPDPYVPCVFCPPPLPAGPGRAGWIAA